MNNDDFFVEDFCDEPEEEEEQEGCSRHNCSGTAALRRRIEDLEERKRLREYFDDSSLHNQHQPIRIPPPLRYTTHPQLTTAPS